MAFITEKEELKPGLILFRRGDVDHRMWYCRMKMPKADRYKTVSLKTSDKEAARERAFDQDADVRFRIKHDVPVFNRPFRDVAREYLLTQEARAKRGEISAARPKKLRAVIEGTLDRYAGSTQVHLIGDERWGGYPAWRRENGAGRHRRNGVREVTADVAQSFADHESERRTKVQQTLGIRVLKPIEVKPPEVHAVPFISDSTIRFEMSIFGAIMNYAVKKRYVPASQRFDERPKLKTMRRDEFTLEEYRKLHTVGRKWIARGGQAFERLVSHRHLQLDSDCLQYRHEASGDEESPLARHHACKRPRGPRDRCLVRAGQGQIAQAGRAQECRRLFRTHPCDLQSHGTGRQSIYQHHRQARKNSL